MSRVRFIRSSTRKRVRAFATVTSALAITTVLAFGASEAAHAQAYQGNPTVVSGSATVNRTTGLDTITVSSDQAVINWTTNDAAFGGGTINFLPAGQTAAYQNNISVGNNFTVLNRIIPTDTARAIGLNGTITSRLLSSAGPPVAGGNVFFYSPGGIVIGATGAIDVGGLLLTSADPVVDGAGNFYVGGSLSTNQAVTGTGVFINAGASITATPQNSFVAAIAPVINQSGTVNVNGSAAYIAAERANITIANGLFDINVTVGSDGLAGVPLTHLGTTTGPVSSGVGDNHRIYMVAIPKNAAITMAIGSGSQLGFAIAGAADTVGNSIILSSGYNVAGNTVAASAVNGQPANITIQNANFTSAVQADASNDLLAEGSAAGTLSFASNADLYGNLSARLRASGTGGITTVAGNLIVSSDDIGVAPGENAVGGTAVVNAFNGGALTVTGNTTVTAIGGGARNLVSGSVGSGTGGTAQILASNNGSVTLNGGTIQVNAFGLGGSNGAAGVSSGFGRGGTAQILANAGNARITIAGTTSINAIGLGSVDYGSVAGIGGAGTGGTAAINGDGGTGNVVTLNGAAAIDVRGFGGNSPTRLTGGLGTGGFASVGAGAGTTVTLNSSLFISTQGEGGDGLVTGGNGIGGRALISNFGAGSVTSIAQNVTLIADATGGDSLNVGGVGGNATSGITNIFTQLGSITLSGQTNLTTTAFGGNGSTGGNAQGGTSSINVDGAASLTFGNNVQIGTSAVGGGNATGQGTSGNSVAGTSSFVATNAGAIAVTGSVTVRADGSVSTLSSTGIDGGNARGGNANISQATGGTINISQNALVSTIATGGDNYGGGDRISGTGTGGDSRIAVNNATITIGGSAQVDAFASGGRGIVANASGGAAVGGLANLGSGVGTLAIGVNGIANANAVGGIAFVSGSGGNATGGQALIGSISSTARITIANFASANGTGSGGTGSGAGFSAGNGTGGVAQLFANSGTVTVSAGTVDLDASGDGGLATLGANGGIGLGGLSNILTQGNGQVRISGNTNLNAQGHSGFVSSGGGNTGLATGGTASLEARTAGSSITLLADAGLNAGASGGSVLTGTAGLALGGVAVATAQSGTLSIGGDLDLDASAFGSGTLGTGNGGSGTAGRTGTSVFGTGGGTVGITGSVLQSANGTGGTASAGNGGIGTGGLVQVGTSGVPGTISYGAASFLDAAASGGSVINSGAGGNGVGGTVSVGSSTATITGSDLFVDTTGSGGNGVSGGAGGNGTGGTVILTAVTGATTSTVTFADVLIAADGAGGQGGAGADSATGGTGGAGGSGTGGTTQLFGQAGNGNLTVGATTISASGVGGDGGFGGQGLAGAGGAGGAGGIGTGGFNQGGTASGAAGTLNTGSVDIASLQSFALGAGGAGGDGGAGTTARGNGGVGGNGIGGEISLLSRGSRVTVGDVSLNAVGLGGDGGAGALLGNGGGGNAGDLNILITNRFQSTNRGLLQAGNIQGLAQGIGGIGAVNGVSRYSDQLLFVVDQSDATIASVSLTSIGTSVGVAPLESPIAIRSGTVTVTGAFNMFTPGTMSLQVENGTLQVDSLGLSASNFVPDTVLTSTNPGTIRANSANLITTGDFIADGNFNIVGDIVVAARGFVSTDNLTSANVIALSGTGLSLGNLLSSNHITLNSTAGTITAGTVTASNFISAQSAGSLLLGAVVSSSFVDLVTGEGPITTLNITAVDDVSVSSSSGAITTGAILSRQAIEVDTGANITTGTLVAGDSITVEGGGDVSIVSASSGLVNPSTVQASTYDVGLRGGRSLSVGQIAALTSIGLAAGNGTMTVGNLTAGLDILALGSGNITTGAIQGGTAATRLVYFGNVSQLAAFEASGFNPALVLATPPVRTLGAITINGTVTTGNLLAGAGQGMTVQGAINAVSGRINLTAASLTADALTAGAAVRANTTTGNISATNIVAGDLVQIASAANLTLVNVQSARDVDLDAVGAVTMATGSAGLDFSIEAGGGITAGSLSGLGIGPGDIFSVGLIAGTGNITVGALNGAAGVGILARAGTVATGAITAGTDALILSNGAVGVGGPVVTATGATNFFYVANSSMASLLGQNFNPAPVFAATPVRSAGAINVAGAINTGNLLAAAGQGFTGQGAITASTRIGIDAAQAASFNGLTTAPAITVASGDFILGQNGALGNANTNTLQLTAASTRTVILGGTPADAGYAIDASEASRLRAGQITVAVPNASSSGTAIELRAMTLNGSAATTGTNLNGASGGFTVQTSGNIRVVGDVVFNGMASENRLTLSGQRVEIAADTGSVFLNSNSPGGTLVVNARNLHVASASLLEQLATNPAFAGRDAALARSLTVPRAGGVLQAARLLFNIQDTLLIQNTGNTGLFAGFLANSGQVQITPSGSQGALLDMSIYGQLAGSDTVPILNNSSVRNAIFPTAPTTGFSTTSSINGCLLSAAACSSAVSESESESFTVVTTAVRDLVQSESEQEQSSESQEEEDRAVEEAVRAAAGPPRRPITPPVNIVNTRRLTTEPIIEEPVSSGGNPNFLGGTGSPSINQDGGQP